MTGRFALDGRPEGGTAAGSKTNFENKVGVLRQRVREGIVTTKPKHQVWTGSVRVVCSLWAKYMVRCVAVVWGTRVIVYADRLYIVHKAGRLHIEVCPPRGGACVIAELYS